MKQEFSRQLKARLSEFEYFHVRHTTSLDITSSLSRNNILIEGHVKSPKVVHQTGTPSTRVCHMHLLAVCLGA